METGKRQRVIGSTEVAGGGVLHGLLDRIAGLAPGADASLVPLSGAISKAILESRGTPEHEFLLRALQETLEKIQATITELHAAVTERTPPPGYRPPKPWDAEQARRIVSFAHKLSYTSFAPPGFVLGSTPLHLHKPPAPQELQLRASQLHELQRTWAARAASAALAAASTNIPAVATVPNDTPQATALQSRETAKEGALHTALQSLPPMPAGWKPGDPIPGLTPAAAPGSAVNSPEPQPMRAPAPAPLLKSLDFVLNADFDPGELEFGDGSSSEDDSSDGEESF
uniref:Mediator complex subunit 4 n=1 Tax=Auxenochlorella protothecoides TaxID=3075 RepID=A0A1D1ZSC0_AUXPR